MSQNPPHPPHSQQAPGDQADLAVDPTRDVTDPTPDDTGPAQPADLPLDTGATSGVPTYGTGFGVQAPAQPSWTPPRAASGRSATGATGATGPWTPPASTQGGGRRIAPGRALGRVLGGVLGPAIGGRVQPWHVVAAVTGLLIPIGFALVSGLGSDLDAIDRRPVVDVTRSRPSVTRTFPAPSITMLPGMPPTTKARQPTQPTRPSQPQSQSQSQSTMTTPPPVVSVPAVPVTPVPTDATRIRFEAYAENGARIEVSLSDAKHQRYEYPVQPAPLAFETPIDAKVSSNDYFSVRVRVYDPTGSGDRRAVSCRVLVDGIVVTTQQGRGHATCYISPYYDIRRR